MSATLTRIINRRFRFFYYAQQFFKFATGIHTKFMYIRSTISTNKSSSRNMFTYCCSISFNTFLNLAEEKCLVSVKSNGNANISTYSLFTCPSNAFKNAFCASEFIVFSSFAWCWYASSLFIYFFFVTTWNILNYLFSKCF